MINYGVEIFPICFIEGRGPIKLRERSTSIWNTKWGITKRIGLNTGGQGDESRRPIVLTPRKSRLFPVVVAHGKDLNHTNEDVDEVQLKADALVDNITLDVTALSQARVVQDLLHIVESKATEDSQTTIQPDTLRPHQRASSGGGENHGSETGESDQGHTSEERTTEVQVLLLLGSSTDKGDRAHQTDGVDTSTSEQSRVVEHQRREERGLGDVESSPEAILCDVADGNIRTIVDINEGKSVKDLLIRGGVESSVHRANAADQANTKHSPWVHGHQAV